MGCSVCTRITGRAGRCERPVETRGGERCGASHRDYRTFHCGEEGTSLWILGQPAYFTAFRVCGRCRRLSRRRPGGLGNSWMRPLSGRPARSAVWALCSPHRVDALDHERLEKPHMGGRAPDALVRAHGRDWVVLPPEGEEPDLVRPRPVDGSDAEAVRIYLVHVPRVEGTLKDALAVEDVKGGR